MTETELALARLRRMVAADSFPKLAEEELAMLLTVGSLWDEYGRSAADEGWVPTYDLNAAAAEGWRWKASAVAHMVDFSADGTRMSKGQLIDHCHAQVALYAKRVRLNVERPQPIDPCWVINL